MKKYLLAILTLFLAFTEANSTHLAGGFISYEYIGRVGNSNNFRYSVTLTIYRECDKAQVDLDDPLRLCIYSRENNSLVRTEFVRNPIITKVKSYGNKSCTQLFGRCFEQGVYQIFVDVPQSNHGYVFEYIRCCRNEQVNLPNGPGNEPMYGQTYKAVVPPTYITNSSPYFNEIPVMCICLNDTTQVSNSATDTDGDSLVYKFARPYAGGSLTGGGAAPDCKNIYSNPPLVAYKSGYSYFNPFGDDGHVSIDSQSGLLELMSRQTGDFVIAVDVEEYRGGLLHSFTRIDMQVHVDLCPEMPVNLVENPIVKTRFEIYPNPITNQTTIHFKNEEFVLSETFEFVLYDMHGRKVINLNLQSAITKFERDNIANGVYFYAIKNGSKILESGKLVFK